MIILGMDICDGERMKSPLRDVDGKPVGIIMEIYLRALKAAREK